MKPSDLRILLLESIHPNARQNFAQAHFPVELTDGAMTEADLIERLKGVHVLGIRSKTQLTAKVLEGADSLMAVGAFCIGTNQVDLEAASSQGVAVFNAPFSNTRSVAELVLSEVVALARQLPDRIREMHEGKWRKVATGCYEVRNKTLGVIGYGHIGRQVGVLAEAFGMKVLFHDISNQLPMGNNAPSVDLDQLLQQSDFVTLHVPATEQTRLMMSNDQLSRMKKGSYLINASRGSVVDIDALASHLKSGHIAGAAVDVFPVEPQKNVSDEFVSPLRALNNVLLTPHIGGSTVEAQENIGTEVSNTLIRFLTTGATTGSVNIPPVELAVRPGQTAHRVTHIHRNEPGVLSSVNAIVSKANANVQAQHLATDAQVGYLIMDLNRAVEEEVCAGMEALDATIAVRAMSVTE